MLFCPKCGTRNRTTYNYCRKCGTKIKFSIEDIKPIKKESTEFSINKYLKLKLENAKTVIYVEDEKFLQCKYLLIEIQKDNLEDFDDIMSIDDVSERLDHSLEHEINYKQLKPEVEFWGHCSNLQAWAENLYDTSLLHSNLAFPLLKKLTDVGDPTARRMFKDEIAERLTNLYTSVAQYLIQENYLEYFNSEELELLMEILFEQIKKKFVKKQGSKLDSVEIEALLSIIKSNLIKSNTFLINRLKPVDTINKETHLGFSSRNCRITAIGLNRCGLRILPATIGDFKNLEELYLTENRLKYLPPSLGNLTNLKKIDLSDNHLIELPIEIGNLISLKELYLNHNVIQDLPRSITKLDKLEILSIWGNQLRNLAENMCEMTSLRILGLSFNQVEELPKLTSEFPNLETLDLSNNKLRTIFQNIGYLKSLKTLWLNNNPIKNIPESLLDLQTLTDLYIVNTPIAMNKDKETLKILENLEAKGINVWK